MAHNPGKLVRDQGASMRRTIKRLANLRRQQVSLQTESLGRLIAVATGYDSEVAARTWTNFRFALSASPDTIAMAIFGLPRVARAGSYSMAAIAIDSGSAVELPCADSLSDFSGISGARASWFFKIAWSCKRTCSLTLRAKPTPLATCSCRSPRAAHGCRLDPGGAYHHLRASLDLSQGESAVGSWV